MALKLPDTVMLVIGLYGTVFTGYNVLMRLQELKAAVILSGWLDILAEQANQEFEAGCCYPLVPCLSWRHGKEGKT